MPPTPTIQLVEYARASRPARIDRTNGVIERVKVLGEAGNHEYPKPTRERSKALFENARVYIDHPAKGSAGRSVRDRMGRLKNVREEGDGLYADWHFNPKHSLAEQVFSDAETDPDGWGFSINGDGRPQRPGSKLIEEITRLTSVDVVDNPATTAGLFESKAEAPPTVKTTLRTLLYARRLKLSEPRRAWLDALLEQDDMAPAVDAPMDMPAEAPAETDPDEALKAGFEAALTALVKAALGGELDEAAAIARFKELLKTHGKLTSKAEPEKPAEKKEESDSDSDSGGDDVAEQKRVEELERREGLRSLCESQGVFFDKLSVGIREALEAPGLSEAARKELVGAAKTQQKAERPRSGGPVVQPVTEQKPATPAVPKGDTDDGRRKLLEYLRTGRQG